MKKIGLCLAATFLLISVAPLYAQAGCVDSPENPTALLALVGSCGGLALAIRHRRPK